MPKSGTAWREPIYVADLNKVLIISLELDNGRKHASQLAGQLPRSPAPALAHTNRSYSSPNTSFVTPDQPFVSPSPSTRMSKAPAYDSQSAASHRSEASQDRSLSPLSHTSSVHTDEVVHCELCGEPFTGLDCRSNLNRHMRTSQKHGQGERMKCPVDRCESILGRTDNLKKHMRKVHKYVMSRGPRGVTKRRRNSARV